jgi:hypothetical protein
VRPTAFFVSAAAILFIGGAFALRSLRAADTSAKGAQADLPRPWTKAWKMRLESPHLTAAEFTQLYAGAALSRLRGARLSVPGPLTVRFRLANGTEGTMSLDNAWRDCQEDPSARVEMCQRWVRVAAEIESNPTAQARNIVPLIRDRQFLDQVPRKPG